MDEKVIDMSYCKHCWPTKRTSHFEQYLNYYLNKPNTLFNVFNKIRPSFLRHSTVWGIILEFFAFLKLVKFVTDIEEKFIFNRSLIFLREAKKINLQISAVKVFGKYVHDFRVIYKSKKYYFSGIPTTIWSNKINLDNKYLIKRLLSKYGIPVSEGKLFTNSDAGLKYVQTLGYPMVVKPNNGSLSHHVTYPIDTKDQLINAIKIAQQYSPEFIIEKYVKGNFYRATVIGKKQVFVCQKDPANIVGDGKSTIKQLIQKKNNHKYRGGQTQKNTTLHQIPLDKILLRKLSEQRLTLNSIPKLEHKVYLQDKYILSMGCDIINFTKNTHPENILLFIKISELLDVDLVGIDFLVPDITKSYKNQISGVIETNSLPYVDMHQYPSVGKGDNIAKVVWDYVLYKLATP